MKKRIFSLLPLVALLMGCASGVDEAECPVLTVEGGQIVGVAYSVTQEGASAPTTYYAYKSGRHTQC